MTTLFAFCNPDGSVSYSASGYQGKSWQEKLDKIMDGLFASDGPLSGFMNRRRDAIREAMDWGDKEVAWQSMKFGWGKIKGFLLSPIFCDRKIAAFRKAEKEARAGGVATCDLAAEAFRKFASQHGFVMEKDEVPAQGFGFYEPNERGLRAFRNFS